MPSIDLIPRKLDILQSYAGRGNQYALEPVVPELVIRHFEDRLQLRLPEDFRSVITQLGNGVDGLFYGLGMRSFRGITERGFSVKGSDWGMPETPMPPPVFELGRFDWKYVWMINKYSYDQWQSVKSRELRSLLGGGTYDLMREQKEVKRLYGLDLKEDQCLTPYRIRGALRLCNNLYCSAYLIVAGAPEQIGRVFQTPPTFSTGDGYRISGYTLMDSFTDFVLNLLETETNCFADKRRPYALAGRNDFRTDSPGATRVVFPDPAAARLASDPFFIEEGEGLWRSVEDEQPPSLGKTRRSTRYALHLPGSDRYGRRLSDEQVSRCIEAAASIGMCRRNWAVACRTNADTAALQEELIWIVYATDTVHPDLLRSLARFVLEVVEQDKVVIECAGRVERVRNS
ncbi:MAG: hypothetical protein IT262_05060 [Saprospiraceae bacterium]|nr:hypothetical protein [Saprospiraceae bacterium]